MSWIDAAPTALALLALLYLPGWAGLRLLGVRGVLAVAAAPAVAVLVLAVGAVLLDVVGVRWAAPSAVGLLGVAVLACAALGRAVPGVGHATPPLGRGPLLAVLAALAAAAVASGSAYLGGMGAPDAVQQIYDPIFHLNAAETIVRTGNASSLGGLDPMYGDRTGIFYPAGWHGIVALVAPLSSVVVATNVLMLLTALVLWPVGVVALAGAVAPRQRLVAVAAPVVASSFLIFPANVLVLQGMFPYALALATTPAAVALAVATFRVPRRSRAGATLATALACAGVVAAHPTGLAVLAMFLLPLLGQEAARAGARLRRAGRGGVGVALSLLAPTLLAALVVAVYTVPRLQAMGQFAAHEGDPWVALRRALLSSTTVGWTSPWANVVVAALVLVGAAVAVTRSDTRWLPLTWALTIGVHVIAAGPESPVRVLTAFWYKSADRTQAMLPTVSAVLAAIGVVAIGAAVQRALGATRPLAGRHVRGTLSRRAVTGPAGATVAAVLVLAFVTSGGFRHAERELGWTAWAFQPDRHIARPYATADELEMIRSLPDVLPEGSVVIGDPLNGETFVQAVAGAVAYLPHINPSSWDDEQRFLKQHFREIHTDPGVCDLVREDGIGYYYVDESVPPEMREQSPGLYDVDVSTGFELVAAAETARVYRITACG